MEQNRAVFIFWILLSCLLVAACANQVAPSGGEPDSTPPEVLLVSPNNKTTMFNNNTIVVRFNEFVTLDEQEILISPFVKQRPTFRIRGKSLIIKFEEQLRDNTTYTINLSKAIKDLNEGNELENFEYVFATGETLDSLDIGGEVFDAATGLALENVFVMLHENLSDTAFTSIEPVYLTRTNKEGKFSINNLPAKTYQLFALLDKNSNYYYDQANESIGFLDSTIQVPDTTKLQYVFKVFNEGNEPPKLLEKRHPEYGQVQLFYTKKQDTLNITPLDSITQIPNNFTLEINATKDTAIMWYRNVPDGTSLSFLVDRGLDKVDTISYKKTLNEESLKAISYITNFTTGRTMNRVDLKSSMVFKFNHPISYLDTSAVVFLEDSIDIDIGQYLSFDTTYNKRTMVIDYDWQSEKKYDLLLSDSTIVDYFGEWNDEYYFPITPYSFDTYGTLLLTIGNLLTASDSTSTPPNYIGQLLNAKGETIKQFIINANNNKVSISYLKAGQYQLSLIEDTNNNGEWDTGNYASRQQAENVYAFKSPIQIKESWETEVEIELKR